MLLCVFCFFFQGMCLFCLKQMALKRLQINLKEMLFSWCPHGDFHYIRSCQSGIHCESQKWIRLSNLKWLMRLGSLLSVLLVEIQIYLNRLFFLSMVKAFEVCSSIKLTVARFTSNHEFMFPVVHNEMSPGMSESKSHHLVLKMRATSTTSNNEM